MPQTSEANYMRLWTMCCIMPASTTHNNESASEPPWRQQARRSREHNKGTPVTSDLLVWGARKWSALLRRGHVRNIKASVFNVRAKKPIGSLLILFSQEMAARK